MTLFATLLVAMVIHKLTMGDVEDESWEVMAFPDPGLYSSDDFYG